MAFPKYPTSIDTNIPSTNTGIPTTLINKKILMKANTKNATNAPNPIPKEAKDFFTLISDTFSINLGASHNKIRVINY